MKRRFKKKMLLPIFALLLIICNVNGHAATSPIPLTLYEAERLSIAKAPELKQLKANVNALKEEAIADGQLSDPKVMVGALNVPSTSFSFTQDDMTMIEVGLQQSFEPGHSLALKSKKTRALASALEQKIKEQAFMLLRSVRETWLDLYYWNEARVIIHKNRSLYRQLLEVAESQYSTGKANQSDVLQLTVELSRLDEQSLDISQRIEVLRAQLGRLIGTDAARRPLSNTMSNWPNPNSLPVLKRQLYKHPTLKVDRANINAARDEVAYAKEQYKPGWMVDVNYGIRQGRMADGQPRSNFLGAQVTIDLPLFTGNRQDKRLLESAYRLEATQLDQDTHYRDLLQELDSQYAIWQNLGQRDNLYQRQLIPETTQAAKAALLAYRSATTDLSAVLRAYSNALMVRLEQVKVHVERAKARVDILYLEGMRQ